VGKLSTYHICEHCVSFYKGAQSKCPRCGKDIASAQTRDATENPFDRKPVLRMGSVRIGSPLRFKKAISSLITNFVVSIIVLAAAAFAVLQIGDTGYRIASAILLVVYFAGAYWIHPEPDHESIQDGEFYWLPHKFHHVNWMLILVAAFFMPGQYLINSIIETIPVREQ